MAVGFIGIQYYGFGTLHFFNKQVCAQHVSMQRQTLRDFIRIVFLGKEFLYFGKGVFCQEGLCPASVPTVFF